MFTECVWVYVWDNCNQLEKWIDVSLHCCNMKVYQSQLCSNAIQFPAKFLKHESPAAPPGTTEISLRGNVAYESYNCGEDQDDDHQYEKLDEYKP